MYLFPFQCRPIRARIAHRLAGQWEAVLKNISIIWISGGRRGGIVWVNPSSKCAFCHSNETDQRNIHTHVNVSMKAYVYDETIYNSCARARFAGCTFLRHIILGLNTVQCTMYIKKKSSQRRACYKELRIIRNTAALFFKKLELYLTENWKNTIF